jgi:methylated-DNA-[protein]-cysteine S-methyltransferase
VAQTINKRPAKCSVSVPATSARQAGEACFFPSDLGWIGICWTGQTLRGFTVGHPSAQAAEASLAADCSISSNPPALVRRLAERLQSYAAGADEDFSDVQLDLSHLTEFQRRVVQQCRRIRGGRTLSYAELAAKAGFPGAARAVGNTMARNRFPIVIPCHRVVGSAGSLGGFSAPSGISLKQRMLNLEGAARKRKTRPR